MARWSEVIAAAPALAGATLGFMNGGRHKVLSTLRADGSPRVSGIETIFEDGDLWFGMMWESAKAMDLRRDPRFAVHSPSAEPPDWNGDATVSGTLEEITDDAVKAQVFGKLGEANPPGPAHLFRAHIREVSVVRLGDPPDHLVVETWREGRGVTRAERR